MRSQNQTHVEQLVLALEDKNRELVMSKDEVASLRMILNEENIRQEK